MQARLQRSFQRFSGSRRRKSDVRQPPILGWTVKPISKSQQEGQDGASAADDVGFQLFAGSAEATWTHDPTKAVELSRKVLDRFVKSYFAVP